MGSAVIKGYGRDWSEMNDVMAYINSITSWNAGEFFGSLSKYNMGEPEKGMADASMEEEDAKRMRRDWRESIEVYRLDQITFE